MKKYFLWILHIISISIVVIASFYFIFNLYLYIDKHYTLSQTIEFANSQCENNNISSEIKSTMSSTIDYLNFSIVVFSSSLALFLILVGFISNSKIKEINKTMSKLENFPEKIVNSFYEKQINTLLNKIFSEDNQEKGEAIKQLSNNPNVNKSHFNIIYNCFQQEYNSIGTNFLYNNINVLLTLLTKIDNDKMKNNITKLLDQTIDLQSQNKIYSLAMYLSSFQDDNLIPKIIDYLKIEKHNLGIMLLTYLLMNHNFSDQYLEDIFKSGKPQLQTTFVGSIFTYYPQYDSQKILEKIIKYETTTQVSTLIFTNPAIIDNFSNDNLLKLLLFITKKEENNINSTFIAHRCYILKIINKIESLKLYKQKIEEIKNNDKIILYLGSSIPEFKSKWDIL